MSKLFKIVYKGYGYDDGVAFVFAKDEQDAINKVRDHPDTRWFDNVKCEQIRKSGVIHNDDGAL